LRIITAEQEIGIGTNIDAEVRGQYPAVVGTPAAARVQRIGEKIAAVSDRRDVPYRFTLIESNQLNAFAAPGGFIYVTTETEKVAATDAELAAIIAHEVGHVAALHSVNQIQRALGYHYLSALVLGENQEEVKEAADIAFNSVIMTGFSRQDELQADDLGVKYSWKAGYDPYGLANFFIKLQLRNQETVVDRTFEFLRSHPVISERRRRAEALAASYAAGGR
ncbi:MAG: M48 family metalloprotease, partial [Planctomycetota bacterium]